MDGLLRRSFIILGSCFVGEKMQEATTEYGTRSMGGYQQKGTNGEIMPALRWKRTSGSGDNPSMARDPKPKEEKWPWYKALWAEKSKVSLCPNWNGYDKQSGSQDSKWQQTDNENCIGTHTFDNNNITLMQQDEGVVENRSMFISHCNLTQTIAVNTFF